MAVQNHRTLFHVSTPVSQLLMYDDIINKPSNDWDLYYWMTGASPIPSEFDNDVMALMVEHAKNTRMEVRITQPPLVSWGRVV